MEALSSFGGLLLSKRLEEIISVPGIERVSERVSIWIVKILESDIALQNKL